MSKIDDNYCCHACVGDPFLTDRIKAEGQIAECAQCGQERAAVTEFNLGQWIETILEAHYEPGEGDSIAAIIEEIVGVTPEFAEEIADTLGSLAGYVASGGETFYDSDDGYVVVQNPMSRSHRGWERFTASVRSEARFFNRDAEGWLDHIFGALSEDRTWRGQEVVKTVEAGTGFFRARHVPTVPEAFQILASPATFLGPLPNGEGFSGRMNAAGVSVFYGALDVDTCIAEIRPPVGSIVVSGRFDLLRPVRVLDFDLLETVVAKCSHFDPEYDAKMERALFLRAFGRRIAQPVMPDDEAFGYLPTQIVADYLAQRQTPPIDGMLYRSTQTGGKGRNIVFFNRAARVAREGQGPPVPSGSGFQSSLTNGPTETDPLSFSTGHTVTETDDRTETLAIDASSIEISDIRAISYSEVRRSVDIWNIELEERDRYPD